MADLTPIYVDLDTPPDPDDLAQDEFDQFAALIPGWEPQDGQLEVWIMLAVARLAYQAWVVGREVPKAIFRAFGAKLVGIPPVDAVPATVPTTWTLTDNAGYIIPQGTQVGIPDGQGNLIGFVVTQDVTVLAGATATAAGEVVLQALVDGTAGNGLTGTPVLQDDLAWVTSIAQVGTPTGGVDAEDDDAYLDRLTREFRLLAPRPILPADFALMAESVAGVDRALAIDLYDADTATSGVERCVTVAVVSPTGADPGSTVRGNVDAVLQANREVNFLAFVIPATYTAVTVTFTATALPGYLATDVKAAAEQAVKDFLSPANWGQPAVGEIRSWVDSPTVYHNDVVWAIRSTPGVAHVTAVSINGSASADLTLTGPAAMPAVNPTVTGTVT